MRPLAWDTGLVVQSPFPLDDLLSLAKIADFFSLSILKQTAIGGGKVSPMAQRPIKGNGEKKKKVPTASSCLDPRDVV